MDTPSLTGRPAELGDIGFVDLVWNDERVALTIGGTKTRDELTERLGRWLAHWEAHGFGATLFAERESGEPIGWGGLQRSTIGIDECLTTGYVIAPSHWEHGFATEIARASVRAAFTELDAPALYASVLDTNLASRRVLEKVGMTVAHELDHGSHVEVVYVIER